MRNFYYFFLIIISIPSRIFNKVDFLVINKKSKFSKNVAIEGPGRIYNSTIGKYSYIGKNSIICDTQIGSFCSIGDSCYTGPGKHPIYSVSSSPVFYSKNNVFRKAFYQRTIEEYERTIIGNDVWIGTHVFIKSGVKIGHGCIIGAFAVVTKDVEPYTVMGGNPARIIRKRFSDDIIDDLLKSEWWNFDDTKIKDISHAFESPSKFIKLLKETK